MINKPNNIAIKAQRLYNRGIRAYRTGHKVKAAKIFKAAESLASGKEGMHYVSDI